MRNSEKLAITALLCVILFVIIMLNLSYFSGIDASVSSWAFSLNSNFLVEFSKLVSYIFEPTYVIIYVLVISLLLFIRKMRLDSIFFALSGLAGGLLIYLTKEIVQRARPLGMLISETGFSFPSGHAAIAVVLFGFFAYLSVKYVKNRSLRIIKVIICILLALVVGVSRLILQVHFFSDVLGGFLIGGFVLFVMLALRTMIRR